LIKPIVIDCLPISSSEFLLDFIHLKKGKMYDMFDDGVDDKYAYGKHAIWN
jgi:hypothetical protein